MKKICAILTSFFAFSFFINFPTQAASDLFYGSDQYSDQEDIVQVECLEGVLGNCTQYQFLLVEKSSGRIITKSPVLDAKAAANRLKQSFESYPTHLNIAPLVAATGVTVIACFGLSHAGGMKGFCPFIPLAFLADVAKAPIVLPFSLGGLMARNIKAMSIVHRVNKIFAGKKAKPIKIGKRYFARVTAPLINSY